MHRTAQRVRFGGALSCGALEEDESEDEQFEVEAILASRPAGRTVEYLVKWTGWDDPADNSWEKKSDIHADLIAEYEATASGH